MMYRSSHGSIIRSDWIKYRKQEEELQELCEARI